MLMPAAGKDLLIYTVYDSSTIAAIHRRNTNGTYELVANITGADFSTISTNGNWIALGRNVGLGTDFFSIDTNNNVSYSSFVGTNGGFLLSDDTFVGYYPLSPHQDGNYNIHTYRYEASNNSWVVIPELDVSVSTPVLTDAASSTYRATDSHLIIADYSDQSSITVDIYERLPNRSWSLTDSVPVNSTFGWGSVTYNGVDTFTYFVLDSADGTSLGTVFIYTKINGEWTYQLVTGTSVGYRPLAAFGTTIVFLDSNNMLLTAYWEGQSTPAIPTGDVGKVLLMTRNSSSGLWEPAADLLGPNWWGTSVIVNDYDVIVPSIVASNNPQQPANITFFVLPPCFTQPINVTCHDVEVTDCSLVDVSSLYTIDNPQCGNVTVESSLVVERADQVTVQFSFTRAAPSVYCNATVTCPLPPDTQVPADTQAPGMQAPPTSKQTPTQVSSTGVLQLGSALLLACALVAA